MRNMLSGGSDIVLHRPRWQLHTENRELKRYNTSIGDGVVLKTAIVVGGPKVQDGTIILNGSCVLKGEELAAHRLYASALVSCKRLKHTGV